MFVFDKQIAIQTHFAKYSKHIFSSFSFQFADCFHCIQFFVCIYLQVIAYEVPSILNRMRSILIKIWIEGHPIWAYSGAHFRNYWMKIPNHVKNAVFVVVVCFTWCGLWWISILSVSYARARVCNCLQQSNWSSLICYE